MTEPIRLAVVDDSAFVRKALSRVFENRDDIVVVGRAASGEELLERLGEWAPTAVTLDLSMPGIGGLETLDRLMAVRPIPVIILSSHSAAEAPLTLEALSRGAADFIDKEELSLVDFESLRNVLLEKLRSVTHVVPGRKSAAGATRDRMAPAESASKRQPVSFPEPITTDLLVIGASTGGPPAIERLLSALAPAPAIPVIVVQHMPAGFTSAFAQRLNANLPFHVREASHGGAVVAGTAYIAPGGMHLQLRHEMGRVTTALSRYPDLPHRPSVDILFRSAAELPLNTVAVLLTGMGDDGARGLLELARRGAFTIAQDEATSIVYGMPRCAVNLGAVREQLPIGTIGPRVRELIAASIAAPGGVYR